MSGRLCTFVIFLMTEGSPILDWLFCLLVWHFSLCSHDMSLGIIGVLFSLPGG